MMAFPRLFSRLPGYNRLTYRLAAQLVWQFFGGPVNRWRRDVLGLPAQKPGGRFAELGTSACPWIVGASPQLIPPQPDWPPEVHLTGYWYPQEDDWQPPAALTEFLDSGPAPVFIGFGSMSVGDPQRTTQIILRALEQAGLRAVLHAGWSGLGSLSLPQNGLAHRLCPLRLAFPAHGGSGHPRRGRLGAFRRPFRRPRAGGAVHVRPVRLGTALCQPGERPAAAALPQLTVERLASALHSLVTDEPMRAAAARLGTAVQQEAGIPAAVRLIEDLSARASGAKQAYRLELPGAAGGSL